MACRCSGEPIERLQAIVECDTGHACHVIVASSRHTKPGWRGWNEFCAGRARKNTQALQRVSHFRTPEAIKAMLTLANDFDEVSFFQAMQVNAGG